MPTVNLSPIFNGYQAFGRSGLPLAFGRIYTFQAGTNTPLATYTTAAGNIANSNPIVLNSDGRPPQEIWLIQGSAYLFRLEDALGNQLGTYDDIQAIENAGAAAALQARLADGTNAANGASLVGFGYGLNYAASTLGGFISRLGIDPRMPTYNAVADGTVSDSAAVQAAVNANPGVPIHLSGTGWRFDTEVTFVTTASGPFTQGFQIMGDGPAYTEIDNRVAGGHCFRVATNTLNRFQFGITFRDFQIKTTTSPSNSGGISLRSGYNVLFDNVWITGLTADAIKVIMSAGDQDGSNMVTLRHCRLESCGGWGLNTEVTGPYNEFSFLRLEQTFIQGCGTASATIPPPSGGMRWKGQIFESQESAFVICQNVGLYVQGGAGLANTVDLQNTTFENNVKRHVYVDGVDGFRTRGMQMYSNDGFITTNGIEFNGAANTIKNIDINGTIVRATSGNNPHTAFKISGANAVLDTCRVRNTSWQNFDSTGQVRFDGWQFDQIQQNCVLVALSTTSVVLRPYRDILGRGNKSPLRLRGAGSTTGEWIEYQVPYNGVGVTNSGLAANTVYYAYLWDNNGVTSLELSTTIYIDDQASGYPVKTGDATRLYVGRVATDAGTLFLTANTGWLNPTPISGSQTGTFSWMWRSGTSGALRYTAVVLPTSDTDGSLV